MSFTDSEFEELAKAPRKVETDEGTVTERSIKELIDADKHLNELNAPDEPLHGLRISRCKPRGAV